MSLSPVLDYSSGHLYPPTIVRAGYQGALRYLPKMDDVTPDTPVDVLDAAEVASFRQTQVPLGLVYEGLAAGWMLGGASAGNRTAHWILQKCEDIGIGSPSCVYLADDSHHDDADVDKVLLCIEAARNVLGDATGIYGFRETVSAAVNNSLSNWQWLTGSLPTTDEAADLQLHLYQRNYGTRPTIAGVKCDVSTVYRDNWGQLFGGDTMTPDETRSIVRQELERMLHVKAGEVLALRYGDADGSNSDVFATLSGSLQHLSNGVNTVTGDIAAMGDEVTALAINTRPPTLAAAIVAALPPGETLTQVTVEAAIRHVLGSLDNS